MPILGQSPARSCLESGMSRLQAALVASAICS